MISRGTRCGTAIVTPPKSTRQSSALRADALDMLADAVGYAIALTAIGRAPQGRVILPVALVALIVNSAVLMLLARYR